VLKLEGTGVFNIARPLALEFGLLRYVRQPSADAYVIWVVRHKVTRPQAILKFRPPSSLDYRIRHGSKSLVCLWEMAWYEATAKEYPIISEVYPNLQMQEWLSCRTPLPQDFLVRRPRPSWGNQCLTCPSRGVLKHWFNSSRCYTTPGLQQRQPVLCMVHPLLSGHPSKYWLCWMLLYFRDRGNGCFQHCIWPLAYNFLFNWDTLYISYCTKLAKLSVLNFF
jgi:hypothetical protein